MSSYYSPPSPLSKPSQVMPATPTGPPPPIDTHRLSQGQGSSYYTPSPGYVPSPSTGLAPPRSPSFAPPAMDMPQASGVMPSFPMAQPTYGGSGFPATQPRTSIRYVFDPMNVEDKKSLDHRLSVPKYVRDAAIVERDSQQRVFTAQTDRDKKQTIVRDEHGAEIARFSWSTWSGSAKIKLPMGKEERCVEWMPRPGTEIKITGSKCVNLFSSCFLPPHAWPGPVCFATMDFLTYGSRAEMSISCVSLADCYLII
jgi:hypothetical protein